MAQANIKAVITAQDNASGVVKNFGENVDRSGSKLQNFGRSAQMALAGIAAIGVTAGIALTKLVDVAGQSVEAANKNQAALTGLASVSRAFGQDQLAANAAARRLAQDGLMTVTDAALGLKNLLASGFSLDQAVTLMGRFKDSAAFGRQSALSFGQAVTSATEGIKNGNSILVDNAGVTKNLSVILEEAGFSAQDLMKATTDASIRQALFNGIIKETNAQTGDAAKLTELFAGKQAMLGAQITILQQQLGTALQPILLNLLQTVTPIVQKISEWVEAHPRLAATIVLATAAFLGMLAVLSGLVVAFGALVAVIGTGAAAIAAAIGVAIAAFVGLAVAAALNIDRVKQMFGSLPGWISQSMEAAGRAMLVILGPIGRVIDALVRVINLVGQVSDKAFTNNPANQAAARNIGRAAGLPGFASGVQNFGGGLAYVHQGEVLANLAPGTSVIPKKDVQGMLGGGSNVNVSISGIFTGTPSEARELARMVAENLKDIAGSKNMSVAEYLT